jgi:hypothetical protein
MPRTPAAGLQAQVTTADIVGTVTDALDAVVAGVKITATNFRLEIRYRVAYEISNCPPTDLFDISWKKRTDLLLLRSGHPPRRKSTKCWLMSSPKPKCSANSRTRIRPHSEVTRDRWKSIFREASKES